MLPMMTIRRFIISGKQDVSGGLFFIEFFFGEMTFFLLYFLLTVERWTDLTSEGDPMIAVEVWVDLSSDVDSTVSGQLWVELSSEDHPMVTGEL